MCVDFCLVVRRRIWRLIRSSVSFSYSEREMEATQKFCPSQRRRRTQAAAADWAAPNFAVQRSSVLSRERRKKASSFSSIHSQDCCKLFNNWTAVAAASKQKERYPSNNCTDDRRFCSSFSSKQMCRVCLPPRPDKSLFSPAPVWLSETNIFSALGAKTR